MRVGIFGGTFDPIHFGHLLLAEQCREQCRLDEVWFLPTGVPPHKTADDITPGRVRVEMLELALAGNGVFRVDRRELERETVCYTVETLRAIQAERPDDELFFLMGMDSLRDFVHWREPQEILQLARLAVVNREVAETAAPNSPQLPPEVTVFLGPELCRRINFVTIPNIDLSSRDMRRRVREGKSIRYMTPRAVETYIQQHHLYQKEKP